MAEGEIENKADNDAANEDGKEWILVFVKHFQ